MLYSLAPIAALLASSYSDHVPEAEEAGTLTHQLLPLLVKGHPHGGQPFNILPTGREEEQVFSVVGSDEGEVTPVG